MIQRALLLPGAASAQQDGQQLRLRQVLRAPFEQLLPRAVFQRPLVDSRHHEPRVDEHTADTRPSRRPGAPVPALVKYFGAFGRNFRRESPPCPPGFPLAKLCRNS